MRIHYFDFVAKGGVHTTFNSAMIEVLNKVYPENTGIILHSEKEHGEIVKDKCLTGIRVKNRTLIDNIKHRKVKDFVNSLYIFFKIIFKNGNDVFFIGIAFPFTINAIYLSSKICKKTVFLCLHGELQYLLNCNESIFDKRSMNYFSKMTFAFSRQNTHLKYILLGKTIQSSVKHLFHPENKTIVINHPALFSRKKQSHVLHKPIVIAQIGGAAKRKGSLFLFKLANLLEKEIKNGKIIIEILGQCRNEFSAQNRRGLVKCHDRFLSDEELSNSIEQIDFSLQLTTDSICTAIASGTLIDSLIFEKPIIGLHSAYFDAYIDGKQSSLVGSSVEDLARLIKNISKNCTEKEYEAYVASATEMRAFFSIETNAELFREGLKK